MSKRKKWRTKKLTIGEIITLSGQDQALLAWLVIKLLKKRGGLK
jgi:hypothetical protein